LNDRIDYFGSTVNLAARLEGLSCGTDVIISRAVFEDAEVIESLASGALEASEFHMTLKGFDGQDFKLWRAVSTESVKDPGSKTKDPAAGTRVQTAPK
jgi:class 3 adenylate cyclase